MHLEVRVGAVAKELRASRPEVGEPGNVLLGRCSGRPMEVDRGHARRFLIPSFLTNAPVDLEFQFETAFALRTSTLSPCRLISSAPACGVERITRWPDARTDTTRIGVPALPSAKSRDDMKPIVLGRVVGDARYLAKVDALGLNRTQAISMGGRHRSKSECGCDKHVAD